MFFKSEVLTSDLFMLIKSEKNQNELIYSINNYF